MYLIGSFDSTVDSKNRVSIPSAMREAINVEANGRDYFVLPGRRKGTLAIYPERYFLEQIRPKVRSSMGLPDELYTWLQFECSQTALVQPDQQGRVVIPDWLLKRAGMAAEVTIIGADDHMEVWRRDDYAAFVAERWTEYPKHRAEAARELARLTGSEGNGRSSAPEEGKQ